MCLATRKPITLQYFVTHCELIELVYLNFIFARPMKWVGLHKQMSVCLSVMFFSIDGHDDDMMMTCLQKADK